MYSLNRLDKQKLRPFLRWELERPHEAELQWVTGSLFTFLNQDRRTVRSIQAIPVWDRNQLSRHRYKPVFNYDGLTICPDCPSRKVYAAALLNSSRQTFRLSHERHEKRSTYGFPLRCFVLRLRTQSAFCRLPFGGWPVTFISYWKSVIFVRKRHYMLCIGSILIHSLSFRIHVGIRL